jgi:hypothetical protein
MIKKRYIPRSKKYNTIRLATKTEETNLHIYF